MVAIQLDEPGDGNVDDMPFGPEFRYSPRRPDGNGFVILRRLFALEVTRRRAEKRLRRFQGQVLLVVVLPITLDDRPSVPALASISVPISEQSVESIAKTI